MGLKLVAVSCLCLVSVEIVSNHAYLKNVNILTVVFKKKKVKRDVPGENSSPSLFRKL